MAKIDIKQHVTDTIISEMEKGTPPWRKPWTGDATGAALPLRHDGTAYRGVNILMLWATSHIRGYASARWMTYRQARALGACVRKGEKATRSVFYGTFEKEVDVENEPQTGRYAKCNNVFNADQIEGLPEDYYIRPAPPRDLGTEPVSELDAFFAATGATVITSETPKAYYSPGPDHIHMPPIGTFFDASGYYGTLGHETVHWTGSATRLDRIKRFEDRAGYAFEELVAGIGACFLAVQLGVAPAFDQSAAYIEGWLQALKSDKGLIFKAAAEAQKAVDFINARVEEQQKAA